MRDFVIMLLTCSATMSTLGLVYMVLTPLLTKRYSEKWCYYTWLIIVIGLIIPFRPHFANAIVTVNMPNEAIKPITQTGNPITIIMPSEVTTLPASAPILSIWQIAMAVWLVGIIIFIAYHAIKHSKFSKMAVRWSEPVTDEQTLDLLQALKTEMGILGQIGLYSCSSVGGPALLGFVKPRILLPQTDFAPEELRFILKHELTHYKRKDLYYKVLVLIAIGIHWFNPVVYLVAKAIDAACELSCDADTVRGTSAEIRQRYSETIISVVRFQSKLKSAISTNFYGGKRGMKNRILSIMNTGKKKTGTAILCCTLILTLGTGMAFSAQTLPKSGPSANIEDAGRQLNAAQISEQSLRSYVDPKTGKTLYSWDGGKTWTEEYNSAFTSPVVEWWTYDEYKAWMEEQIVGLQAIADDGIPDYYDKDGVLRNFTQADVDEAMVMYQSTLDDIKRGVKVSKAVYGSTDTISSYYTRDIATTHEGYNTVVSMQVASGDSRAGNDAEQNYDDYARFGLSYHNKKLYYNDNPVRCFDDWYSLGEEGMYAGRSYFDKDGTVDVYAERDFSNIVHNPDGSYDPSGKLTGVRAAEQAEFDVRDLSQYTDPVALSITTVDSMRESLRPYERFGVSYDEEAGMMMYDGFPVRELYDHKKATLITLSAGAGFANGVIPKNAIDLKAVYEGNVLTGLKKSTQEEFDVRTLERQNPSPAYSSATGISYTINASSASGETSNGNGRTIAEIFEDYAAFGVTFNTKSVNGGLGNIYYNGKLVKQFTDIAPDGGVLSCSSSDGGTISLRTVYDASGNLAGLEVIRIKLGDAQAMTLNR